MKLKRIGVDLAKNVFQIHGVDSHEKPVWRQRLPRDRWLQTVLEKIEPGCEVGMDLPVFKKTRKVALGHRDQARLFGLRAKECAENGAIGVEHEAHLFRAIYVPNQIFVPSLGSDSNELVRCHRAKLAKEGLGRWLLFPDELGQSRTKPW